MRSSGPLASLGSSPHTRGARLPLGAPAWAAGIIPAYAGSTALDVQDGLKWRDHPRIRGEHATGSTTSKPRRGSSPHTRGAPDQPVGAALLTGIIPAYAGSTWFRERPTASAADHPRIRGEHALRVRGDFQGVGSSPHTRGALLFDRPLVDRRRIIPAYAGSTPPTKSAP